MTTPVLGGEPFTAAGLRSEAELTLPRPKPRLWMVPMAYLARRLGQGVMGRRRMLRVCLNGSWLLKRFAHELSGEVYGHAFHCAAMGLSEALLRRWIPDGGSVLDVGCGTGRWSRVAARYARRVVGIDYNPASLDVARRLTTEPHVEYRCGDVTQAMAGERVDVAILVHVLEHIEDVNALLRSMAAIASTLIVEVPDFESDGLNYVRRQIGCPWYTDEDHVREYTRPVLREHLSRNGWELRAVEQRNGALVAVASAQHSGSVHADG